MSARQYELDVNEFRHALRRGGEIPGDRFREADFQDVRCAGYVDVNQGSIASTLESKSVRSFIARYFLRNHVGFAFLRRGRDFRFGDGPVRHIPGCSVMVSTHTSLPTDILRPAGHLLSSATVFVERDYLVDCYGLRVDHLPEQCRNVFRGLPNASFILNLTLSARCSLALDAIFACKMAEPRRSIYWKSKCEELLAETIDTLNGCGKSNLGKILTAQGREQQLIESAAEIYRRNLKNPPSIAELARKLGINRNKLTEGFKDIFGKSPGDYGKGVRLDWAKQQLVDGVLSIGQAAYATGYSNPSAFGRAYREHFGAPPSSEDHLPLGGGPSNGAE